MTLAIEATFDGKTFHPDAPVELKPNTRVMLIVENEAPDALDNVPVSPSFLQVARDMKLQGPSDWAENIDSYLVDQPDKANQSPRVD